MRQLNSEIETANKSIHDKERQLKQEKKENEHLESTIRNLKTSKQEIFCQLNIKETELKNSEKAIDNLKAELKKQENLFEK